MNSNVSTITGRFMPKIPQVIEQDESLPYRLIPLSQGQVALVDIEDFEELNQWSWHCFFDKSHQGFYARRALPGEKKVLMHRYIMRATPDVDVDHRDTDSLNNRRSNLRVATRQQNCFNRGKNQNNNSGYKGVAWHKAGNKWRASIAVNRKTKWLGLFNTAEEAAIAYNLAALEFHGEFAYLNPL